MIVSIMKKIFFVDVIANLFARRCESEARGNILAVIPCLTRNPFVNIAVGEFFGGVETDRELEISKKVFVAADVNPFF